MTCINWEQNEFTGFLAKVTKRVNGGVFEEFQVLNDLNLVIQLHSILYFVKSKVLIFFQQQMFLQIIV